MGGAAQGLDTTKLSRGFATLQQTVKEKTGGVGSDDITELPQGAFTLPVLSLSPKSEPSVRGSCAFVCNSDKLADAVLSLEQSIST